MTKTRVITTRVSEETMRELSELQDLLGENCSAVVTRAITQLAARRLKRPSAPKSERPSCRRP